MSENTQTTEPTPTTETVVDHTEGRLFLGDCMEQMAAMEPASVDLICTDPPYGLVASSGASTGFMNKAWDASGLESDPRLYTAMRRIARPGSLALVFGATRTIHKQLSAAEAAGWIIQGQFAWVNSQGMSHGLNMEVALKKAGASEEEAAAARGMNSAIRPAMELVAVLRAPLVGTYAENLRTHGLGAFDVDAARIPHVSPADRAESENKNAHGRYGTKHGGNKIYGDYTSLGDRTDYDASKGRWPSDVFLSHSPDCTFEGEKEVKSNSHHPSSRGAGGIGSSGHKGQEGLVERRAKSELVPAWDCAEGCPVALMESQKEGSSRFFSQTAYDEADFPPFLYVPKASASERNAGCEDIGGNTHVCIKPQALLSQMLALSLRKDLLDHTPVCYDPFLGSGSTAVAAILAGWEWKGAELTAEEYGPVIRARVAWAHGEKARRDEKARVLAERAKKRVEKEERRLAREARAAAKAAQATLPLA